MGTPRTLSLNFSGSSILFYFYAFTLIFIFDKLYDFTISQSHNQLNQSENEQKGRSVTERLCDFNGNLALFVAFGKLYTTFPKEAMLAC